MRPVYGYDPVHAVERATLEASPEIGSPDVSQCLPVWVKSFCEKFVGGDGWVLSHGCVKAILHTLIAARARQHRLIAERDSERRWADHYHGKLVEAKELGFLRDDFDF